MLELVSRTEKNVWLKMNEPEDSDYIIQNFSYLN